MEQNFEDVITREKLHDFGYIMASAFAVIGIMPFILRLELYRSWTFPFTAGFLIAALIAPEKLRPFYKVWMKIGTTLGLINSKVILAVIFFVLITPIALMLKVVGKDVLATKFHKDWESYRQPAENSSSFKRQF